MAYIVIRRIKNRLYRYLQRTYRHEGRVKTESTYLGPVATDLIEPPGSIIQTKPFADQQVKALHEKLRTHGERDVHAQTERRPETGTAETGNRQAAAHDQPAPGQDATGRTGDAARDDGRPDSATSSTGNGAAPAGDTDKV